VDDRLIHGQVVVKWLRHLDCKDILVVDDGLRQDEFMQTVLRMAAPDGVRVRVASVAEAAGLLKAPVVNGHGILVLARTPQAVLALLDRGVSFTELNVGGLGGGAGTARLFRSVSANESQLEAMTALHNRGVRVYIQMVPEEHPLELGDVLATRSAAPRPAAAPEANVVQSHADGG
jgi:mannose/fructose/N-acetylgalactosamine-specific phosphotransferase system component IIB